MDQIIVLSTGVSVLLYLLLLAAEPSIPSFADHGLQPP